MLKIIKNEDRYELVNDENVLGKIIFTGSYLRVFELGPRSGVAIAKIFIGDKIYNTEYFYTGYSSAFFNYDNYLNSLIKLFDNLNQQISVLKWHRSVLGGSNMPAPVTINLNGIEYFFASRPGFDRLLVPSSRGWFDKEGNEYMYLTIKNGLSSNYAVSIETELDLNDENTKLLALWGFHLLPVPKKNNLIKVLFVLLIVCPFLLWILYNVFLPYF